MRSWLAGALVLTGAVCLPLLVAEGACRLAGYHSLIATFGAPSGDSLFLPYDAVHPTPQGHALIARLLHVELCRAVRAAAPGASDVIYRAGCGAARHP